MPVDVPIIRHNRHAFDAPLKFQVPHPYDLIIIAAVPVLEEYNRQSAHHEADPLLIEALSISPTLMFACDTTPAVHCLVRYEFFAQVQLKLVCDLDAGWSAGTVMVRDDERWIPLKDWLRTLTPPTMKSYQKPALEAQYQWWRSTGKPFRLLDVPRELQRRIFFFALGEYVEPEHHTERDMDDHTHIRVILTQGTKPGYSPSNPRHNKAAMQPLAPVNLALLGLSKDLRELAVDVLWGDTTKRYRSPELWGYYSYINHHVWSTPPSHLHFMRRIQLALDNSEYVQLFGVYLRGVSHQNMEILAGRATVFKELPNLKYLELYFQSTAYTSYSPWLGIHAASESDKLLWYQDVAFDRLPCQKVLTEWILCYAAEHIHHVPTVELSGCIKTCTKQKWERLLNEKGLADHTPYFHAQKVAIRRLPASSFPPRCFCPKFCGDLELRELEMRLRCETKPKPWEWKKAMADYSFDYDDTYPPASEDDLRNREV